MEITLTLDWNTTPEAFGWEATYSDTGEIERVDNAAYGGFEALIATMVRYFPEATLIAYEIIPNWKKDASDPEYVAPQYNF